MPNGNPAEAANTLKKDRKVSNGMLVQSMASCGPKLQGNPPVNPDMEERPKASSLPQPGWDASISFSQWMF